VRWLSAGASWGSTETSRYRLIPADVFAWIPMPGLPGVVTTWAGLVKLTAWPLHPFW
jgi:hypothetical protein